MRDINTTILPAFHKQIKLIVISDVLYGKTQKASHCKSDFQSCCCPVCEANLFTYHCQYEKYHYNRRIRIIRIRCQGCGSTHALIPEFSLPGTSIGTQEADDYMKARARGVSQTKGAVIFTKCGLNQKYGISLEKRFSLAHQKSRALFPDTNDPFHNPVDLFFLNRENDENMVLSVNHRFSGRGFNPLYFSRSNILMVRENKLGVRLPLNPGATGTKWRSLDSS